MRRIKLNDRVSFPEVLNMNKFVDGYVAGAAEEADPGPSDEPKDGEVPATTSTNDAAKGSAAAIASESNGNNDAMDVVKSEQTTETKEDTNEIKSDNGQKEEGNGPTPAEQEREKLKQAEKAKQDAIDKQKSAAHAAAVQKALKDGPLVYELFAILVHGGSALGGHYYAYIKVLLFVAIWAV